MDKNLHELEEDTKNINEPMTNWTRVIVETDEKNPKLIALITNEDCESVAGVRVRVKPVY